MQKTYLFYDIETTGLNKCFDQVLQFAAIRTDLALNELERFNVLIKLNPDVMPSPGAFLVHNIGITDLKNGICEYEAIKKIHQLMNHPGTISLGYNSLGFDDEFLRFSFYRNLLPPYTHQYANDCSRMDLYPIAAMYFLYKAEALNWPKIDEKSTLKLEYLSGANDLAQGSAHDAMVDVEATVELARRLIKYKDMWDYLSDCFNKNTNLMRMRNLTEAIMVDGSFGADNFYQCYVLFLGRHKHYKNQTLWLRLDWSELPQAKSDDITSDVFVINRKDGETNLLLPTNSRFMRYLTQERLEIIKNNKDWLDDNPEILVAIKDYYLNYKYPVIPNVDIDAALYQNGFWSREDEYFCAKFHAIDLEEKVQSLEQVRNSNLREQALRILGRNYPGVLSEKYLQEFQNYLEKLDSDNDLGVIIDYRGKRHLTRTELLKEISELKQKQDLTIKQENLLNELAKYTQS